MQCGCSSHVLRRSTRADVVGKPLFLFIMRGTARTNKGLLVVIISMLGNLEESPVVCN